MGTDAAHNHPAHSAIEPFQVGVPDPRDVAAVGDAVVQAIIAGRGSPDSAMSRVTSFSPAGFFTSIRTAVLPSGIPTFEPPECRAGALQALAHAGWIHAEG